MRLFCISFALLLYANVAHAVQLTYESGRDANNLTSVPVDNLDGYHCSDARDYLVDAPKGLRWSAACREGDEGFVKHTDLVAVFRADERNKPNKPYMCCIQVNNLCRFGAGIEGPVEVVTEKDTKGVDRKVATDCSGYKKCKDPRKNFCLQEAANIPTHFQRKDDTALMEKWNQYPVCCPKHKIDKTCDYAKSDYVGEEPSRSETACEYVGRCSRKSRKSLCSMKKNDKTASSCCQPHDSELCPFGIYPFGVKSAKTGLMDWIMRNSGDPDAWKKACLDLSSFGDHLETYLSNDKCCAKAKLKVAEYYGNDHAKLLTDEYELLSTVVCKNDTDCGEGQFCGAVTSSFKDEWADGKGCFEKIQCPHKTATVYPVLSTDNKMICDDSSTCPNGTTCVWGKPATPTAAKVKQTFGMCCPKAAADIVSSTTLA